MPKHILHVFSSLNMGGAESRIMDVTRTINRQEYQFDFLTMKKEPQYFDEEIAALGCREIRIRQPRETGIVKNFLSMYRILKKGHYDAVHCHTSFHCGLACFAAWLAGIRIRIAHARTTGSKNKSKFTKNYLSIGRLLVRIFSNTRLAISRESGEYLFGDSSFEILPNAIDTQKYQNVSSKVVEDLRQSLDIQTDSFVIGLVGRFEAMKNHEFALKWFRDFLGHHGRSVLILVGDGELRARMETLANDLQITEHVRFTGIRKDIPVFMRLFNVLIVPSIFEGLGGTILEAQASGTPVVKSDTFTDEADMGLGLVYRMPLDKGYDCWTDAVEKTMVLIPPEPETRENAFVERRYSLQSEVRRLCEIYSK